MSSLCFLYFNESAFGSGFGILKSYSNDKYVYVYMEYTCILNTYASYNRYAANFPSLQLVPCYIEHELQHVRLTVEFSIKLRRPNDDDEDQNVPGYSHITYKALSEASGRACATDLKGMASPKDFHQDR